jgi:hypothetical protein
MTAHSASKTELLHAVLNCEDDLLINLLLTQLLTYKKPAIQTANELPAQILDEHNSTTL